MTSEKRLHHLAERLEEYAQMGEIPEWEMFAQSSMIQWVHRRWNVSCSYAWQIVKHWVETYDKHLEKYMRM